MTRAAALLVVLTAAPAFAQQSPELVAQRRALIDEAQGARRSGDHAHAVESASRALEIEASPSLRRFVAEEQAAAGNLAAALGSAELCVRDAEHDASQRTAAPHAAACRVLAESLRGRVARLVVRTPADAPADTTVLVAGAPLVRALWNTAAVVNPGQVVVEASASGRQPFHGEVDLAEGVQGEVAVSLEPVAPPPEDVAHRDEPPPDDHVPPPHDDARLVVAPAPHDDTLDDVGAPLTITLGAIGLGVAAGLYVARSDAITARNGRCDTVLSGGGDCAADAMVLDAQNRAVSFDGASTAMWIAGGVIAALGVAWLVVDLVTDGGDASRRTASLSLTLSPEVLGVRGRL